MGTFVVLGWTASAPATRQRVADGSSIVAAPTGHATGKPSVIRILAITRKPESASFLQRVAGYVLPLQARNIEVECATLPSSATGQWRLLGLTRGFDGIWWHRHLLAPWWLPRLRRHARRIVFDFDDPLTSSSAEGGRPSASRRFRFARMLSRCDSALAGSEYLASLAQPYCPRVTVLRMAIDLPPAAGERQPAQDGSLDLLWVGSAATQPYLEEIRPVLELLPTTHPHTRLRLVAHQPMSFGKLRVDFRKWSPDEEASALRECHVGLCPMPDTLWTRGKCPYKVIQYLAHGLPWVGSAVGENIASAGHGTRGFCAGNSAEWSRAISQLLDDSKLRLSLGHAGRAYAAEHHDRVALTEKLAAVWHNTKM